MGDSGDLEGADLHAHSRFSDGLEAPAAVVAQAAAAGLAALALTDHDNLGGLEEAAAAAARHRLRLIPGVEISCRAGRQDVHLLGWFVDPGHGPLQAALARLQGARERRLAAMLKALGAAGAPVSEAEVRAATDGRAPGRPHVAAALVAAGHARSMQDAFDRWLKPRRAGFVPLERLTAEEAIARVRAAGGVVGLAHPGLGVDDPIIESLAAQGLAALEADHPAHTASQRRHYAALARRLGLVATAGSDFHGDRDRHGTLGEHRTPAEALAALQARRA